MAPATKSESDDDEQDTLFKGDNSAAADAAFKARLHRKRTKTGCLTCRKRRIKCGEERPVCKNCIKSKRHCDGYAQRVIFKPPTFDYRALGHGGAHITFQTGPAPGPTAPYHTEYTQAGGSHDVQPHLQPRPVEHFVAQPHQPHQYHPQYAPPQHYEQQYVPQPYAEVPHHHTVSSVAPQAPVNFPQYQAPPPVAYQDPHNGVYFPQIPPSTVPYDMPSVQSRQTPQPIVEPVSAMMSAPDRKASHVPTSRSAVQWVPEHPEGWRDSRGPKQPSEPSMLPAALPTPRLDVRESPISAATYVPRPELTQPIDQQVPQTAVCYEVAHPHVSMAPVNQPIFQSPPEYYDYEPHLPPSESPTHVLSQAAVENHDDDYYDVQSDEEMDLDTDSLVAMNHDRHRTLGRMLHRNDITVQEMQMRRYDTFLYHGMLDHYRVEEHANPLRNPATARVFAHFISVTGPSLSIFERHPRNTSVLFTQGHIPFSQQGLWTYTMPMAALHHQGLLHAMLALASLHIARLNHASHTPSMQHYAWALRRVHQCVGKPKKRLKITTIATTMLLGFYEIMTADHMKWNMHLAGARQLFVETDFVTMAQQFRRMKLESRSRQAFGRRRRSDSQPTYSRDDLLEQIPDVDERVISQLVGREVRYGDHGQVMTPSSSIPTELDLSKYEILKDLYWWYCKQDAYQSIVSGNALLMDFSRWANCPPRAPLNKPDAVYGTFDHLMLLLARVADFSSRDRERKLRQMELNDGQWKPAPGMQMPTPPRPPANAPPTPMSANGGLPMHGQSSFPGQAQPLPMFFGMAPPPRQNVQMPSSYGPLNGYANGTSTPQSAAPHEPMDIRIATQAALDEYGQIRAALFQFASSLGEAFQPLSFGEYEPKETAFGPVIFYRSFDIGTMWAVYNMAEIIAIRSHPHNPPAAHMAAGIAARDTAPYAQQIGRIVAGIVSGPPDHPLNPSLGAALCESCMPSFFAAVQYQDPHQRSETVERIYDIAERTGWGSAELIANGCETAWVKAAAMGRGPPYQRTKRKMKSDDPRVNGSWEKLDPNAMPDESNDQDRRLIKSNAPARLNWAIGIVGTEDDMDMSK